MSITNTALVTDMSTTTTGPMTEDANDKVKDVAATQPHIC